MDIAGNVIAILQLTTKVVSSCHDYITTARAAVKEIPQIVTELYALKGILEWLQSSLNGASAARKPTIELLGLPNGPLERCQNTLRELENILEAPKLGRHIVWPFKEKSVLKLIGMLERDKTLFMLALQGDHINVSEEIERYCRQVHDDIDEVKSGQKRIASDISDTRRNVEELSRESKKQKMESDAKRDKVRRENILEWLLEFNPISNHRAAQEHRHRGTGGWFVDGKDFDDWCNGSTSVIWLHGIRKGSLPRLISPLIFYDPAGAGKTILTSAAIDKISTTFSSQDSMAIAYFYFDFKEPGRQQTTNMMLSMLGQLVRQQSEIPPSLQMLYRKKTKEHESPTLPALLSAFQEAIKPFSRTYFVLDALDECCERHDLLEILRRLIQGPASTMSNSGGLKILVASRDEQDIALSFSELQVCQVQIRNPRMTKDIEVYITETMETEKRLKTLPTQVKQDIIGEMSKMAGGMFRWVECQFTVVRRCRTINAIKQYLKTMPKDLDETYERILRAIPLEHVQLAYRALLWLAFCTQPMTISQLAEAIIVEFGDGETNEGARLFDPSDVLDVCGSLVTVVSAGDMKEQDSASLSGGRTVALAHFSVKEFLLSGRLEGSNIQQFATEEVTAKIYITQICLTYLTFDKFTTVYPAPRKELDVLYPLAAKEWIRHAGNSAVECQVLPLILRLLTPTSSNQLLTWLDATSNYRRSSLSISIEAGLLLVVQTLLETGAEPNARERKVDEYEYPLQHAVNVGNAEAVKLLLKYNADPTLGAHTALDIALLTRNSDMVALLLDHEEGESNTDYAYDDIDLDWFVEHLEEEFYERAALNAQSESEFERLSNKEQSPLLVLLKRRPHCGTCDLMTATATLGWLDVVRSLLENGVLANSKDTSGKSPLHAILDVDYDVGALLNNHSLEKPGAIIVEHPYLRRLENVARLLIDSGAHINELGPLGEAPWEMAYQEGLDSLSALLIEKGCDYPEIVPESLLKLYVSLEVIPDGESYSLLGFASCFGMFRTVRQLLNRGEDPNATASNTKMTALHLAAGFTNPQWVKHGLYVSRMLSVMHELLGDGANPNLENADGLTPLDVLEQTMEIDDETRYCALELFSMYGAEPITSNQHSRESSPSIPDRRTRSENDTVWTQPLLSEETTPESSACGDNAANDSRPQRDMLRDTSDGYLDSFDSIILLDDPAVTNENHVVT
ncbi:ankyrin [Wilcoxina mikolae CBS 423.85]|nr:ankyrin [Wilcoxina mikolae CBS 423.85]